MLKTKRPLKVFLCYAREDKEAVRALYNHLVEYKVNAWLDEEKLLPGQDWDREIHKAIRESDVIIVVLSKKSIAKEGYVQKEIRGALDVAKEKPDGTIFVIPARLDDCNAPESLNHWHWVDLNATNSYGRLLMALASRAEQIGALLPISNDVKRFVFPRKRLLIIFSIFFVLVVMLISMLIRGWPIFEYYLSVPTTTPTQTFVPLTTTSFAFIPTLIKTSTIELTHTPTVITMQTEITDDKGVGMVFVPSGNFLMGREGYVTQQPVHTVYTDDFYIDKFEITNKMYRDCVNAGACEPPKKYSSDKHSSYFDNMQFDDYPIMYVNWYMAKNYCEWRGARLPTEAEWEKSARGTDGRTYPWGNTIDCSYANYLSCVFDQTKVGSYEKGRSIYGTYDMAGNVWEWVSSIFSSYPYNVTDGRENLNTNSVRAIRGGSAGDPDINVASAHRDGHFSSYYADGLGFRCANDVNP